ncbi:MAG: sigma-70 family RNA polymerase sigma factor [Deltaproteobacteria bacterium]|nr:sigma-70 family RNA polymerase sigma factor [Deltaproteobacteria bacterium]
MPVVHRVARGVARRLPPHIDVADLVGAGAEGLVRAARAYDPMKCERFETYAEARIRGAILDELRSSDAMTRYGRRIEAAMRRARSELERELGRTPTDEELAARLKLPLAHYRRHADTARRGVMLCAGGMTDPDLVESSAPQPELLCVASDTRRRLAEAIAQLSPRKQEVLGLYFAEECTQAEIGRVLGVTESRVCQILSEAIARLRSLMGMDAL